MKKTIDLRSDTFTTPCIKMKEAMFQAKVGDDVYGEDPSVNLLEKTIAKLTNKEDALFTSSGTQANLLALLAHCKRGEEYICGQEAHIYKYEAGGASVLGSVQPQPLDFKKDGSLSLKKIKEALKPKDSHFAQSKIICLENTHDGKVLSLSYLKKAKNFAKENNLLLHIDGARVFNAAVALDVKISEITQYADSVSICLSKGLGAPIGSLLVGSNSFIEEARRYRKMLGGGMRQAGYLAAAGLYALEYNIDALKNDHENAKELKKELKKIKDIKIISNDTNMLFIEVKNSKKLLNYLKEKNILISGYGKLRLVTHRDISKKDIQKVIRAFKDYYSH